MKAILTGTAFLMAFAARAALSVPGEGGVSGGEADCDNDGLPDASEVMPDFALRAVRIFPGGISGRQVAADLDGDGDADLAGEDGVVIFSRGDGTFTDPMKLSLLGGDPSDVAAADLDRDGDVDLVFTARWGEPTERCPEGWCGRVSVFLNRGDGTFAQAVGYEAGWRTQAVAPADLDGDGDIDLAVANASSYDVSIFINRGEGGFEAERRYAAGIEPHYLAAADLDGDGDIDLAVPDEIEPGMISVLLNRGDGSFEGPPLEIPMDGWTRWVIAADLDVDGDIDLAVPAGFTLMNGGKADFIPGKKIEGGIGPTADLDGDGDVDIVSGNEVFLNRGDGSFDGISLGAIPGAGVIGDFDGDGDLDLAYGYYRSVVFNLGNGHFRSEAAPHYKLAWYPVPSSMALLGGDVDGDDDLDLMVLHESSASMLENQGNGTFLPAVEFALPPDVGTENDDNDYLWFTSGDVDGDLDLDLLVSDWRWMEQKSYILLFPNVGDGTFLPPVVIGPGAALITADLDGDGDLEITGVDAENHAFLLLNGGGGAFSEPVAIGTGSILASGDLDGDGDVDLVARDTNRLSVLFNRGDASFTLGPMYTVESEIRNIAASDLDSDSDLDLMVMEDDGSGPLLSFLINQGQGAFLRGESRRAGDFAVLDLDRDGDLDLATLSYDELSLLSNRGNANFTPVVKSYYVPYGSSSLLAGDLDGDGDTDLATDGVDVILVDPIPPSRPDCNRNGVPDECDLAAGDSRDGDLDGVPDECEADCNRNGIPDIQDLEVGRSGDCELSGVPDECEIAAGTYPDLDRNRVPDGCDPDCNRNGLPDGQDLRTRTSVDCDWSGVPDECEIASGVHPDLDVNGIPDGCDPDCNGNGAPDGGDLKSGASADCNGTGIPDECEVRDGAAADLNGNGVPDECDPDCNRNGLPDDYELSRAGGADCNGSGVPDSCEIESGASRDGDGNGIPDECEPKPLLHRGDPNGDREMDIADAIFAIAYLYLQGLPPRCMESADFDNDGRIDSSDPILILGFLFLGMPPPPDPGPPSASCGVDPDERGSPGFLPCEVYRPCM